MVSVERIHPRNYISPWNTFNLLLLSEGFTASQEAVFIAVCNDLRNKLLSTTPFNISTYKPSWINIYRHFIPSNIPGPAIDTTAGDTVFLSTYNSTTGELRVDADRVATITDKLSIPGEDGEYAISGFNIWKRVNENRGAGGAAVIIILPSIANGTPISGEMEYPERYPPAITPNVHFTATTIDKLWHQVVMRVIARVLGLGDEFELEGPNYLYPNTDESVLNILSYPNLIHSDTPPNDPPTSSFQWYEFLTEGQRKGIEKLNVIPHRLPLDTPDYRNTQQHVSSPHIQLVEGGGGYRTKVYRSAGDCLMRRQIGGKFRNQLPLKEFTVPFCFVCQSYIRQIITNQLNTVIERRRKISNQTLIFDDVSTSGNWDTNVGEPILERSQVNPGKFPLILKVKAHTPKQDPNEPFWTFTAEVGPPLGLQIHDLKLKNQPFPWAGEDVSELIKFTDLKVAFDDNVMQDFEIDRAFREGKASFELGVDGKMNDLDKNYLWGLKLTLEQDFKTDGALVPVRIEMSLVLKGQNNDIDPGGVPLAVKIYPQIGMTWRPASSNKVRVKSFQGTVWMNLNNFRKEKEMRPLTHELLDMKKNVGGVFTDTNSGETDGRRRYTRVPAPYPFWARMFDYYRAELTKELEFIAVFRSGEEPHRSNRIRTFTWPTGGSTAIKLEKKARQGAYDNIHIHGFVGNDSNAPSSDIPMVHAPFCGEACFHLHWRWGPSAAEGATLLKERFLGWNHNGHKIIANDLIGAPLIPPNQQLRIAITLPSTKRSTDEYVIGPGTIYEGDQLLDPLGKTLWYSVDIKNNIEPGERQVILEQGIGWAFTYKVSGTTAKISAGQFYADIVLSLSHPVGNPPSVDDLFHYTYETIRWFHNTTPKISQVPKGNEVYSEDGITMEEL